MHKGKIAIILLTALILISLSLAGSVFYMLQQERKHSLSLQEELDDTKAKLQVKVSELGKYKDAAFALEARLKEANDNTDKLNIGLQQEKDAKQQALYELEQSKAALEQQKSLRADLEKKVNQAQAEMQKLQAQLKDLTSKKDDLEAKLKDLQGKSQGVELGTIVVSNEGAGATPPAAKNVAREQAGTAATSGVGGKVLVLNKDYNFAVLNLGSKDGVRIGDVFSVYHGNKYIGDVKVEKVHDSMSAAGFASAEMKGKISEGDKVTQKTK